MQFIAWQAVRDQGFYGQPLRYDVEMELAISGKPLPYRLRRTPFISSIANR